MLLVKGFMVLAALLLSLFAGFSVPFLAQPVTQGDMLLQTFLQILLTILTPILLAGLGALGRQAYKQLMLSKYAKQFTIAQDLIWTFVLAAEQYGLTKQLTDVGIAKKKWVLDRAEVALADRGIHLDLDMLSDIIEAAVLAEINKPKAGALPDVTPAIS